MQILFIPRPFDVVYAATWQYLQNVRDEYLVFRKNDEVTGAFVVFVAHSIYGKIELRKEAAENAELTITDPPSDSRYNKTAEELTEELVIYTQEEGPRKQYSTEEQRQNIIALRQRGIDSSREMRARHKRITDDLISLLRRKFAARDANPPETTDPQSAQEASQNDLTIESILEAKDITLPLGVVFYRAAEDMFADKPSETNRHIWAWVAKVFLETNQIDTQADDLVLQYIALKFLSDFPTVKDAAKKFPKPVPLSDFLSPKQKALIDQTLKLTLTEAETLLLAQPLIKNLGAQMAQKAEQAPIEQPATSAAVQEQTSPIPKSKRGPKATPDTEKIKHVKAWLDEQGITTQEKFCRTHLISPSSLRKWVRQFKSGELKAK